MRKISRISAMLASAAALSMAATPALARGPGWGGSGWDGGWRGERHHGDGIDGGDILTGLLILGGIAVIAGAASNGAKNRDQRAPLPEPRYSPPATAGYGVDDRPQWSEGGGINSAINRCMDEVDRGRTRVDSVDAVNRAGDGWRVEGRADGGAFSCTVDGDGRIRQVTIDGHAI